MRPNGDLRRVFDLPRIDASLVRGAVLAAAALISSTLIGLDAALAPAAAQAPVLTAVVTPPPEPPPARTALQDDPKTVVTSPPKVPPAPADVPPPARREESSEQVHGVTVGDPYRWLEKADAPDVQEWMRAQDSHARAELAKIPARESLRKRFTELLYVDRISAPYRRGGRLFYTRQSAKQEKAVLCWRLRDAAPERVLLDPNTMSADGSVSLGGWAPSYDGRYLAYTLHRNNADDATLYVRDIDSGSDLPRDVIEGARYAQASWTPDSKGFYYTRLPVDPSIPASELPGYGEVRFHALVTDPKNDPLIHPALHNPSAGLGAYVSRDGRYLLAAISHGWTSTDIYFKELGQQRTGSPTEAAQFRPLVTGRKALYTVTPWKGAFYVLTNEGAPRYRVFKVDPAEPARERWKEIVPEQDAPLDAVEIVGGRLVLIYLVKAAHQMEVRTLDGAFIRAIELPGLGSTSGMVGNPDEDNAYFGYSSFTQVPQIFRTSVKTGKTTLWETIRYPADTSGFTAEQAFYPSKDGTRVSIFLVHRKDMVRNGNNPTLLTGYGGFNVNETPAFSAGAVVWLDRGGVLAIPNLRGGGEYGEDWHRAGMLDRKQNVFDDFIAAAEFLITTKITSPSRLAISGGSNGGLLVGAAMVQRPDLFRAVVCAVPLLDMVRYHLFGAGKTWIEEYGSADDPAQFKTLYAYSPYHHVQEGAPYPALLILSADSDDRVDPMHARKFAAAIEWAVGQTGPLEALNTARTGEVNRTAGVHAAQPAGRPVLLRIETHAGHGGADMIRQRVEQQADTYAFLIDQLGAR